MKVIALLPVRNEAWILPHTLACLSGFCDVVLVCDQQSEDASRDICARFPKVAVLRDAEDPLPQRARWRLLDAARDYVGCNFLWNTDADEFISPALVHRWLGEEGERLSPGTFVDCGYYHAWDSPFTYRNDGSAYAPHLKDIAFVDDRRVDYARPRDAKPLHEPRVPPAAGAERVAAGEKLPVLHLQWLLVERNQMKQAWYRAIELLDRRSPPAEINLNYAHTLLGRRVRTTPVPEAWVEGLTFPDFSIDTQPAWQERELLAWFDQYGIERFEPLEIWHVKRLRDEFQTRTGRQPRPDRSYLPTLPQRTLLVAKHVRALGRRAASAAWRRMFA